MTSFGARSIALALALGGVGACHPTRGARQESSAELQRVRQVLCADIGESNCAAACAGVRGEREHADCLLRYRFGTDERALGLARALASHGTLIGVETRGEIEGYRGETVELIPALPLGDHAHHLDWIRGSLVHYDGFLRSIAVHATKPIAFAAKPDGFVFFRTNEGTYPSAFCAGGFIAYNLDGPLHAERRTMHETLFHELFHLSDQRAGDWSEDALEEIFDAIVDRCDDDHACYEPYAPHESLVEDGTFYAFDARTRSVREYAAEIALTYFLEHEALFAGTPRPGPPFKCRAPENAVAWRRLVDTFFGGVDLTRRCPPVAGHHMAKSL